MSTSSRISLIATILIVIFAFSDNHAQANPGSGSLYVGGTLSFASETEEIRGTGFGDLDQTTIRAFFSPSIGYYVTDVIVAGVGVGMEYTHIDNDIDNTEAEQVVFSVVPFIRYTDYLTDNLRWFGELSASVGVGDGSSDLPGGGSINTDITTFEAGLRPGFTYHINETFAIEPSFGFIGFRGESLTHQEELTDGAIEVETESGEFVLDYDFSLGVQYYF